VLVRHGAPLNIRILLPPSRLEGVELSAGGVIVPIRLEPAGDAVGSVWLTPRDFLAPFTEYTLRGGLGYDTFVTRDSRDVTPPRIDDLAMGADLGSRAGHCGITVGGGLAMSGYSDDTAIGSWVPVQVDLETDGAVRRIFVPFMGILNHQEVPFGRMEGDQGNGQCFGPAWFPEAEEGRTYRATATVYDWAGNSIVVDGLELTASRVLPGGCGSPIPGPVADGGPVGSGASIGGGGCSVGVERASTLPGGAAVSVLALACLFASRRRHSDARARRAVDRSRRRHRVRWRPGRGRCGALH